MKCASSFLAFVLTAAVVGQEETGKVAARKSPAVETKRGVVLPQHASAKAIAAVLTAHFKGDAEIHACPESAGNCLLVNAPPPIFDEVVATIERLDRRLHRIAVDVFIVEFRSDDGDDKKALGENE